MRVSVFQYLYIFAMLLMRTNKSIRKYYVICLQYYLVLCLFVYLFTIIKVQSKNIFFLCPHSSLSLSRSISFSLSIAICMFHYTQSFDSIKWIHSSVQCTHFIASDDNGLICDFKLNSSGGCEWERIRGQKLTRFIYTWTIK